MLDLDAIMHNLIEAKLGKGIVDEWNPYHWIRYVKKGLDDPGKAYCLFCDKLIKDVGGGADKHALKHVQEHNLTAFL